MKNFLINIRPYFSVLFAVCITVTVVMAWILSRVLYKKKCIFATIPTALFAITLFLGFLVYLDVLLPETGVLGELIIVFGTNGIVGAVLSILYCCIEKLWNEK